MRADSPAARARWPMARRSDALELLDGGRVTGRELRTNLEDLARLNRLPGGTGASIDAIRRLLGRGAGATILDVGTGGGDMPAAFARIGWQVVAIEADPEIAAIARGRLVQVESVRVVEGDARRLELEDRSVDVAHASLLLHHLEPADAVAALREMARVARSGVVINDLRRGIVPLLATGVAVAAFGRCRTTRHDGLLSVRRAHTLAELDAILHAAGLTAVRRSWSVLPRVVTAAVGVARA